MDKEKTEVVEQTLAVWDDEMSEYAFQALCQSLNDDKMAEILAGTFGPDADEFIYKLRAKVMSL